VVRIVETRPLSKMKRWRVEEIIGRSAKAAEDTTAVAG
jgi:ribosomal protein S17